jgi:pimeloyl-ACP methyl ester carboxylesterase
MAELHREMVDVDGRATAVFTGGSGEPLVWLHGGGIVEGVDCFAPLADRFRFIAPRMPGFDRTDLAPPLHSIDELVELYSHVFDALGLDEFVLAGHSLGGWVASSFAAAHPERVRRLVIACSYGLRNDEHPIAPVFQMTREELYPALSRDASVWAGRLPAGEDSEFDAARAREGESLSHFVPGPFDPALAGKLARLTMPILLMWGDDDQIVPIGRLPDWQAALPQAEVRVYPGVGHLLYWEQRAAVDALGDFASAGR